MPVRNPVTRSGRGFRGRFPSWKLGRMVEVESRLELAAAHLLEFSAAVQFYEEQPALIEYPDQSGIKTCYPDFLITSADKTQCWIEVKAAGQLAKPEITKKYRSIAEHFCRQGSGFRILTEEDLFREPLRSNLVKLQRHLFRSAPSAEVVRSLARKLINSQTAVHDLEIPEEQVWCLVGRQVLFCDLHSQLLTVDTVVTAERGFHAENLF